MQTPLHLPPNLLEFFNHFFNMHPLTLIPILLFLLFLSYKCLSQLTKPSLAPPSPLGLPILGHLLQLGAHPHRTLHKLAHHYGELMLLRLGATPTLVVSTAETAREIMKTHDANFSNRPRLSIPRRLVYDGKDIAFAPYGEYFRQIKSICVLHLLSNKRVKSFGCVRVEETGLMVEKIRASGSMPVNLSELLMALSSDIVCRVAFGRKYGRADGFSELLKEFTELMGVFNVGDFIPWLGFISKISGLDKRVEKVAKEFDDFLESVVQEHLDNKEDAKEEKKVKDFVDVLLELQSQNSVGFPIDRKTIKALIMDMFAAGTNTTATTLEWAMSELLKHSEAMKKVQEEVWGLTKGKASVEEEDLENMKYLKAVINETLRLHPPVPLLVPRQSTHNVTIHGYKIAANTQVIVNACAIHLDPSSWADPVEFKPERFLDSSADYKRKDFQFIPFGGGRIRCPGMLFGTASNELVLASLVREFDWALPDGIEGSTLDMDESSGLSVHRKNPLLVVATPY